MLLSWRGIRSSVKEKWRSLANLFATNLWIFFLLVIFVLSWISQKGQGVLKPYCCKISKKKIFPWKRRYLSIGVKVTLIDSVLSHFAVYPTSVCLLPKCLVCLWMGKHVYFVILSLKPSTTCSSLLHLYKFKSAMLLGEIWTNFSMLIYDFFVNQKFLHLNRIILLLTTCQRWLRCIWKRRNDIFTG